MFCTKCGYKNDDEAVFCAQCGNPLQQQPMTSGTQPQGINSIPGAAGPIPNTPGEPAQFNSPFVDSTNSGQYINAASQYSIPSSPLPSAASPNKNRKRLLLIIIPLVLIIAAAAVATVLFLKPKKAAVLDDILDALQGTLEADSLAFTLDYSDKSEYYEYDNSYRADGILEYDLANGKLNMNITTDEETEFLLYDGISYFLEDGSLDYSVDIQDNLDMLFEYYKEYNKALDKISAVDWENAIEEAGLSSFVDTKALKNSISELQKKLNDKAFYQKVCKKFEIKTEGGETVYLLDFDTAKLVEEVLDIFEPVLEDNLEDIKDSLVEQAETISECRLEVVVKDKRITSFDIALERTNWDATESYSVELELEDYNKASIDEDKISSIIAMTPGTQYPDATSEATVDTSTDAVPTPIPETTLSGELDLWYMSYDGGDPVIQDAINRFTAEYPDCIINIRTMEYSAYNEQLAVAMVSGDGPDILATYADNKFLTYARDGYIKDITDYMERFNYKDRFLDASIAQGSYYGRIYGVPVGGTTLYGVFYNKEIFSRYGLSEPSTIEELEQICDTLLANGITPFQLGNSVSFFGNIYFSCLAARKSGIDPFMSALNGDASALEDGYLYAGGKIQEWIRNGYFNEDYSYADDGTARSNFSYGSGAMYVNGSWNVSILQTEMTDYSHLGFFEFPAYTAGDANSQLAIGTFGDTFYSISDTCENPDAAFELISYLIDDTAIAQRGTDTFLPPLKDYVPYDTIQQEIMEAANRAASVHAIYDSYLPTAAASQQYTNLSEIFALTKDPQDAFNDIASFISSY